MANPKDKAQDYGVGTVTAPPVSAGRPTLFKAEVIKGLYESIKGTGELATLTDKTGAPVVFTGDKAKQQAGGMATRVKKALINSPDTHYQNPKDLKSRTWDSGDGKYVFAVFERPADDADEGSE